MLPLAAFNDATVLSVWMSGGKSFQEAKNITGLHAEEVKGQCCDTL